MAAQKTPGGTAIPTGRLGFVAAGKLDTEEYRGSHTPEAMLADVRAVWWSCRRQGVPLPPQRGVIVVTGLGE